MPVPAPSRSPPLPPAVPRPGGPGSALARVAEALRRGVESPPPAPEPPQVLSPPPLPARSPPSPPPDPAPRAELGAEAERHAQAFDRLMGLTGVGGADLERSVAERIAALQELRGRMAGVEDAAERALLVAECRRQQPVLGAAFASVVLRQQAAERQQRCAAGRGVAPPPRGSAARTPRGSSRGAAAPRGPSATRTRFAKGATAAAEATGSPRAPPRGGWRRCWHERLRGDSPGDAPAEALRGRELGWR
eukprot:TRINITY_DN22317_c1_g1_i2.p1 TRINITY_DN22317_c1_g1~~TRINITY_DN22317_c1_g1_i2.p1  ORF type:complete len:273 (+),score=54.82 TRINITY_DN22317_c1_g1_i2:75-821(+)